MESAERVRVFWQPGCTSCLRTKEFLTRHGVDYESINVHGNEAGMQALRELGARSVPVVARGGKFVFAQSLSDVVRFLELDIKLHDKLSPQQLVDKLDLVLVMSVNPGFGGQQFIASVLPKIAEVRRRVDALKPDEGLIIVAPFLPSPLIELLGGEGFASKVERGVGADWIVYFWRVTA